MVQMYIEKKDQQKHVLIERILPTQMDADHIKKLPDICRELDNVHSRMS